MVGWGGGPLRSVLLWAVGGALVPLTFPLPIVSPISLSTQLSTLSLILLSFCAVELVLSIL